MQTIKFKNADEVYQFYKIKLNTGVMWTAVGTPLLVSLGLLGLGFNPSNNLPLISLLMLVAAVSIGSRIWIVRRVIKKLTIENADHKRTRKAKEQIVHTGSVLFGILEYALNQAQHLKAERIAVTLEIQSGGFKLKNNHKVIIDILG